LILGSWITKTALTTGHVSQDELNVEELRLIAVRECYRVLVEARGVWLPMPTLFNGYNQAFLTAVARAYRRVDPNSLADVETRSCPLQYPTSL